jgi:hypothetical protein
LLDYVFFDGNGSQHCGDQGIESLAWFANDFRKELVVLFDLLDKGLLHEDQELVEVITKMHDNRYVDPSCFSVYRTLEFTELWY